MRKEVRHDNLDIGRIPEPLAQSTRSDCPAYSPACNRIVGNTGGPCRPLAAPCPTSDVFVQSPLTDWITTQIKRGETADLRRIHCDSQTCTSRQFDQPVGIGPGHTDSVPTISAAFLRHLLTLENLSSIYIIGMTIQEPLCIDGTDINYSIALVNSDFKTSLVFHNLLFASDLTLDGSHFRSELDLSGTQIDGTLSLRSVIVDGEINLRQLALHNLQAGSVSPMMAR